MDSDDAVCLTRIAQGDHQALGKLYAQYRPSLYRYLWHYLHGDDYLVEEVLQDTFLAIWRGAAAFRGEARVATWIFRIARYSASHAKRSPRTAMLQTVSLSDVEENEDYLVPVGHEERTLTRLTLLLEPECGLVPPLFCQQSRKPARHGRKPRLSFRSAGTGLGVMAQPRVEFDDQ